MRSALAFLTTLPVGGYHAEIRRGTLIAFPFAGMVLGLSWWAAAMVGARVWGPVIAASIVLVVDLGVTGGLHLDGLADVADGVGSQRRGDALREVLGDPRIGAIGAATLATALLLRFAAILSLVTDGHAAVLVLVPIVGRVGMVLALATLPRTPGSMTDNLVDLARGPATASVVAVLAVGAMAIGLAWAQPVRTIVAAALGLAVAVGLAVAWRRRHEFGSGDVVGAAGLLAETVVLLALAA